MAQATGTGESDTALEQVAELLITSVQVHGDEDATVRVSDLLVVTITSGGSVYYIGSPTVDATITGTGQVVQIGTASPFSPIVIWAPGQGPPDPIAERKVSGSKRT